MIMWCYFVRIFITPLYQPVLTRLYYSSNSKDIKTGWFGMGRSLFWLEPVRGEY